MKQTFLNQIKPLITCMIQTDNPLCAKKTIRNAMFDGCDAFGFQMEVFLEKYRSPEYIKPIFAATGNKPIYITNYGISLNNEMSDDKLVDGLLMLLDCGATLIDIPGDTFKKDPIQLTSDSEAIRKQRSLIDLVLSKGGEVLMSSHTFKYMNADEILRIAREHKARGADISKIVTAAYSEDEEIENLRTTEILRRKLDLPFLFLSVGTHCKEGFA